MAENTWPKPSIGKLLPNVHEMLVHYFVKGYEIIVYTARPESHKQRIWDWLKGNELEQLVYDVHCGKPRAGLYIDDRAWNPWEPS